MNVEPIVPVPVHVVYIIIAVASMVMALASYLITRYVVVSLHAGAMVAGLATVGELLEWPWFVLAMSSAFVASMIYLWPRRTTTEEPKKTSE